MQDRPPQEQNLAQICEINCDIYSFSFYAVWLYIAKE